MSPLFPVRRSLRVYIVALVATLAPLFVFSAAMILYSGVLERLVELHRGTVAASSEGTGRGATFTVRLPRYRGALPMDVAERGPSASAGRRIVLIEDNADTRTMLKAALESMTSLARLIVSATSDTEA